MSVATKLVCPACGRADWRDDLRAGDHALLRCRCGLRALDRAPDDASVLADNEAMYGGEEYNTWYRSVKDVLLARYRRDLDEIEAVTHAKGTILDVGCSYGWFLEAAAKRGWRTIGVEATDATARDARAAGLDVRSGTLEEIALPDSSVDVVCLWDVLEHVPGVDDFLAEIHRVLKPSGVLAIQSPNIASVMARRAGAEWAWLLLPQHVWHFTPGALRAALQRRGFAVERAYTWEPPEALVESLYRGHPRLGSRGVRRVTDKLLIPAHRLWCAAGRGGLLRAYARRLP